MALPTERRLQHRDLVLLAFIVSLPFLLGLLLHALSLTVLVKYAVMGAVGVVISLGILSYPKLGILFGILYIYAGLSFYFHVPIAYPVIILTLFAMIFALLSGGSVRLRDPWFIWSAIFFTLFAVQSMLFSYSLSYSLLSFSSYLKVLILTVLIAQFIVSVEDLELLFIVVFAGAVASVLLGVLNLKLGLVSNLNVIGGANLLRFSGTFQDPNTLALVLSSALPMGIYTARYHGGFFWKLVATLGVLALIVATFVSFTRAAIFPILFVILAVIIKETKRSKLAFSLFVITGAAVVILFVPAIYWNRILALGNIEEMSTTDWSLYLRLTAAKVALGLFAEHPFTGVGLRNFIVRSGPDLFVRIGAHNSYLEILVGTGIFGFLSLMAIFWSSMRRCLQGLRSRFGDPVEKRIRNLSFYTVIALISPLLGALFLSSPFSYSIWIPLAAGLVLGRIIDERSVR